MALSRLVVGRSLVLTVIKLLVDSVLISFDRQIPSTSILRVPLGILITCKIVDRVPCLYTSLVFGFSISAFFCAVIKSSLLWRKAYSTAAIDDGLPTIIGKIVFGKITTFLSGKSAKTDGSCVCSFSIIVLFPLFVDNEPSLAQLI